MPDWETTTVEFKRQVNLKLDKEKAEFVRDVLALATTKASGRRWLVIGFDNNTHQFTVSVDPAITQDRLEDILNAYASPAPQMADSSAAQPVTGHGTVPGQEDGHDQHRIPGP